MRGALARLINADPSEIVLTNSTSYGLDLLAQGLPLRSEDEVLVVEGDFRLRSIPGFHGRDAVCGCESSPLPRVRLPERLRDALSEHTRVVCTSWVFSFTARTADVPALVDVCREHGEITFVLNGSQAVGARPTDVNRPGVDALVSCGFKWLCGPYATGFACCAPS